MSGIPKVSRRSVSIGALATAGCFAGLERQALARAIVSARNTGKPVLTEATLNAAIPRPDQTEYTKALNEAATDIHQYLSKRFALTDRQLRQIRSIRPDQLQELSKLLKRAAARGDAVSVQMVASTEAKRRDRDGERKIARVLVGREAVRLDMQR